MKRIIHVVCLGLGFALWTTGCGGEGGTPEEIKSVQETQSRLESAFEDSNPEAQKQTENLVKSLGQQNYDQAYRALNSFQTQTVTNMQQVMAVEDAYRRLQYEVLQAMEKGDPNAKRIWQQIKQRARN
jgi:TRAP-type mannitol/chloroaromatic compound transport system substrate-binding protein